MPETTKPSQTPTQPDPANAEEPTVDQKLDRIAGDAAKQAGKTQNRYDEGHDIFTK
jgi:hypothetical protein